MLPLSEWPREQMIAHLVLHGWEPRYGVGPEMVNRAHGLIFTGGFTGGLFTVDRLELAGGSCEWGRFSDADLYALVRVAERKGWL